MSNKLTFLVFININEIHRQNVAFLRSDIVARILELCVICNLRCAIRQYLQIAGPFRNGSAMMNKALCVMSAFVRFVKFFDKSRNNAQRHLQLL